MSEVNEQNSTTQVSSEQNLNKEDAKELVEFVMGDSLQPPVNLDKIMTNLYQKLQMTLGYSMAANVKRMTRLQQFVTKCEEEVFSTDDEYIQNLDPSLLVGKDGLYTNAVKSLDSMLEFQRRFLAQNKDTLTGQKTQTEELAQQLMALSPSKLESIMKIVRGETITEQSSSLEDSFDETV